MNIYFSYACSYKFIRISTVFLLLSQINSALLSNAGTSSTKFDAQAFSRLLLQLTSGSGFALKVLLQFLKPINGCDAACGSDDTMLRKMCFLGRMQNIKQVLEQPEFQSGSGISNSTNILMVR